MNYKKICIDFNLIKPFFLAKRLSDSQLVVDLYLIRQIYLPSYGGGFKMFKNNLDFCKIF
jgi:hypothetical protein